VSRLGLADETVSALLATGEGTARLLELLHGNSGKSRGSVVLGGVVVDLVDGHGGVGDVRLNGLLLDHRLDGLVDVVVLVLASNNGCDVAGGGTLDSLDGVTVLGTLLCKASLNLVVAAVLVAAVLDGDDVVVVLLREDLLVEHRLLGGVVVVLVNLLVDGGDVLLVLLPLNGLVLDSRSDLLVNGGVVLTRLGHEVLDGGLSRVHFDWCLLVVGIDVWWGESVCCKELV